MATMKEAKDAATTLKHFISKGQLKLMLSYCKGEEGEYFRNKLVEMAGVVDKMPATQEQDGLGDKAVAHLHYFVGNCDWWITEKDAGAPDDGPDDGQLQAFGLASLGFEPELGYISLQELFSVNAELDLHFKPITLGEVQKKFDSKCESSQPVFSGAEVN